MAAAPGGRRADVDERRVTGSTPATAESVVNLANALTVLRLAAALPVALLVLAGRPGLALGLFLAAAFTDILDGLLAKRVVGVTPLGATLDPIADKCLLILTLGALVIQGSVQVWVLGMVIVRDLLICLGVLLLRHRHARFRVMPSVSGKLCTLAQILLVTVVLVALAGIVPVRWEIVTFLHLLVAFLTLASGLGYLSGSMKVASSR